MATSWAPRGVITPLPFLPLFFPCFAFFLPLSWQSGVPGNRECRAIGSAWQSGAMSLVPVDSRVPYLWQLTVRWGP